MKIKSIEYWTVSMPMEEPYAIAYDHADTATNVFLRLETDSGLNGFGCAAPEKTITGETPEGTLQAFRDVISPALRGHDPFRQQQVLSALATPLEAASSALAALDMALFDLLGKQAELPLWKLLGGFRERIATSITIGILPEAETVERAKARVKEGFLALKLKGGLDWQTDAARVRKVREAVGSQIGLYFDGNQGFTSQTTLQFAEETKGCRLTFIEQPTPASDAMAFSEMGVACPTPLMADESVMSFRDALGLLDSGVKCFNVKLMKMGGICSAQPIVELAKYSGLQVMVGCMDESALGIAAGLHFALSSPGVTHADLDGHIGLKNDPAAGAVLFKDGYLLPKDAPGLGLDRL